MKLSVIIIFCDKDFIYLDSMIDMVEKFVKVELIKLITELERVYRITDEVIKFIVVKEEE